MFREKSSGGGGVEESLARAQMGSRAPCYEAFEVGQVRDDVWGLR